MFESKSGVFLIAGLGSFAFAFLSNALLPILMYRHLPEKTARQTVNFQIMNQFEDLYDRYADEFEAAFLGELPDSVRNPMNELKRKDERQLHLFSKNEAAMQDLCAVVLKQGRKIYVGEACWHCHSQFIRPVSNESVRWGPVSQSWEYQNELQRPVLFGTRRIGPDLSREVNRRGNDWHAVHLFKPQTTSPGSVMPEYPWFFNGDAGKPNRRGLALIAYLQWLGSEWASLDRTGDTIRTLTDYPEHAR